MNEQQQPPQPTQDDDDEEEEDDGGVVVANNNSDSTTNTDTDTNTNTNTVATTTTTTNLSEMKRRIVTVCNRSSIFIEHGHYDLAIGELSSALRTLNVCMTMAETAEAAETPTGTAATAETPGDIAAGGGGGGDDGDATSSNNINNSNTTATTTTNTTTTRILPLSQVPFVTNPTIGGTAFTATATNRNGTNGIDGIPTAIDTTTHPDPITSPTTIITEDITTTSTSTNSGDDGDDDDDLFTYRRGISLPMVLTSVNPPYELSFTDLSIVVLFNLSLAHHLLGSCSSSSDDDDDDAILRKALQLYKLCYGMIEQSLLATGIGGGERGGGGDAAFTIAITLLNNMGVIYHQLDDIPSSCASIDMVVSLIMVVVDYFQYNIRRHSNTNRLGSGGIIVGASEASSVIPYLDRFLHNAITKRLATASFSSFSFIAACAA